MYVCMYVTNENRQHIKTDRHANITKSTAFLFHAFYHPAIFLNFSHLFYMNETIRSYMWSNITKYAIMLSLSNTIIQCLQNGYYNNIHH